MANEKQVVINVNAKDFIVRCSEEFAEVLEDDIALISGGTKKIELKSLIKAFVEKSHRNYLLEKEINKLVRTLNKELP
ncbi:hypothetical protein DMB92_07490 [Campylobacter sp. MIT 99-7217]|uniref:hypothetical protein n=1 Tax=Campylobacter sp. MIT 99-7217 TaxID=535091 RepID=UPI0011591A03|nr:hypothetical protein [Campylobacter sp. MIT 99-7217]TQR30652.1 hypothetical protein DMB92_07490 [Campylobacter sp. MIT 99-7217]